MRRGVDGWEVEGCAIPSPVQMQVPGVTAGVDHATLQSFAQNLVRVTLCECVCLCLQMSRACIRVCILDLLLFICVLALRCVCVLALRACASAYSLLVLLRMRVARRRFGGCAVTFGASGLGLHCIHRRAYM